MTRIVLMGIGCGRKGEETVAHSLFRCILLSERRWDTDAENP